MTITDSVPKEIREAEEDIAALMDGLPDNTEFKAVLNALPLTETGILEPAFWRYYRNPWIPIFYEYDDPFNDTVALSGDCVVVGRLYQQYMIYHPCIEILPSSMSVPILKSIEPRNRIPYMEMELIVITLTLVVLVHFKPATL